VKGKDRRQSGQSLVESVLVTLVFLTVVIGMIDIGQILFIHQSLVERVRATLRYGATQPYDSMMLENMILYNQPTVPVSETDGPDAPPPSGFLGVTRDMITVSRQDATLNEDRLVITVQDYPFHFFTPFVAGAYSGKPIQGSTPYESP
jgi:hypothetical protein